MRENILHRKLVSFTGVRIFTISSKIFCFDLWKLTAKDDKDCINHANYK